MKTAEELLSYPTPFWIKERYNVEYCVKVHPKKNSTAIQLEIAASCSDDECIVHGLKFTVTITSNKWDQYVIVDHPDLDSEKMKILIRGMFNE